MQINTGKKILLTGGHAATTAISVIEELIRRYGHSGVDISWIGPRFPIEGKKVGGFELKVWPEFGVKTYFLNAGRLQRKFTRYTIPSLLKIPVGLMQAFSVVAKIKPDIVLSFGGFTAFPVVLAAWLLGIPILIHEQTSVVGLSNKLSNYFAQEILLGRAASARHFRYKKTVMVGNPVLTQIGEVEPKTKIGNPPVILVMGGSRGSEWINKALFSILLRLLEKYQVVHLTGESNFAQFAGVKNQHYQAWPYVSPLQIDNLYREADIVVARSGANTVAELMVVKRPAILIPIPWSHLNEQVENAKIAQDFGIAKILPQADLSGERLLREIEKTVKDWDEIIAKVKSKHSDDILASAKVVDVLAKYLK